MQLSKDRWQDTAIEKDPLEWNGYRNQSMTILTWNKGPVISGLCHSARVTTVSLSRRATNLTSREP
jgi:hypothetical protein